MSKKVRHCQRCRAVLPPDPDIGQRHTHTVFVMVDFRTNDVTNVELDHTPFEVCCECHLDEHETRVWALKKALKTLRITSDQPA